jgi:hypothetical protein
MHATDLVGINGIIRVLLAYTCQQGVYLRGHVLPPSTPIIYLHPVQYHRRSMSYIAHIHLLCPNRYT